MTPTMELISVLQERMQNAKRRNSFAGTESPRSSLKQKFNLLRRQSECSLNSVSLKALRSQSISNLSQDSSPDPSPTYPCAETHGKLPMIVKPQRDDKRSSHHDSMVNHPMESSEVQRRLQQKRLSRCHSFATNSLHKPMKSLEKDRPNNTTSDIQKGIKQRETLQIYLRGKADNLSMSVSDLRDHPQENSHLEGHSSKSRPLAAMTSNRNDHHKQHRHRHCDKLHDRNRRISLSELESMEGIMVWSIVMMKHRSVWWNRTHTYLKVIYSHALYEFLRIPFQELLWVNTKIWTLLLSSHFGYLQINFSQSLCVVFCFHSSEIAWYALDIVCNCSH